MDLQIKSIYELEDLKPTGRIYSIHIDSSYAKGDRHIEQILSTVTSKGITQKRYLFDDIWPGIQFSRDKVMFTEDIALHILGDFSEAKDNQESLVVSCTRGINRSPAVAIALNEIYSLGHDTFELMRVYTKSNWHVYNTLLKTAQSRPDLVR